MDQDILDRLKEANIPMEGDRIKFEELFDKIENEKREFMNKKQALSVEIKKISENSNNVKNELNQ